ncbi:elongation factor P--(R)-beta-lysine ligase [Candidatus Providencia siddallii]|uniref:Elongation factor P--(R)-beta-lysine ligase n=1 Tax=Candidatus Providencia siddallii TaxID=1715285 RepID=A0ABM9NP49_9GAMM
MNKIINWKPSISINNISKRANIIKKIRKFFNDRSVIEVETPTISHFATTDVYISSFKTILKKPGINNPIKMYLITSPEYHMKRLLAAGSGPIFQLCRCFRNKEIGKKHNPEFTMLEWYRPCFDMYNLINEVNDLFQYILKCDNTELSSYKDVFIKYLNIDPLLAKKTDLLKIAINFNLKDIIKYKKNKDSILEILFEFCIRPFLGKKKPITIYHFPSTQALLAKINKKDCRVSERFEIYYKGMELANGFDELTNFAEQQKRLEDNNIKRNIIGLPVYHIDKYFLSALKHGLPNCSGVAVGVDRLIMIALNSKKINDVIAFPINIA